MTEEEIKKQAEKYLKSKDWNWEQNQVMGNEITQAFQSGAKWGIANAIQWHDLRENPNDLPTKNDEYCCFVYEHGYEIHRFNISKNCFLGVFSRVIAWCELPQFKE